jgi:hypothetical protein
LSAFELYSLEKYEKFLSVDDVRSDEDFLGMNVFGHLQ